MTGIRPEQKTRFVKIVTGARGKVSIRPALSRRTRLRLAATRRIDITCGWLVERGRCGAAVLIWRVCGLWPKPRKGRPWPPSSSSR